MGENEQGGMLRTVVVIGIIAMVALIITLGVVGLKSNMSKNTDKAVGTVVKTTIPYGVKIQILYMRLIILVNKLILIEAII